jgi:hypothetical protein
MRCPVCARECETVWRGAGECCQNDDSGYAPMSERLIDYALAREKGTPLP